MLRRIPLWFKIVCAVLIFAAVLLAVKLPAFAEAKQAYDRGLEAEKGKKYVTALNEYNKAAKLFHFSKELDARMGIAYYYNNQTQQASEVFDGIVEKRASRKITSEVNSIVKKINSMYYMSEELGQILSNYGREELEKTRDKLLQYSAKYPDDSLCLFYLGNIYYDMEKYRAAIGYYDKVLAKQPEFFSAYLNIAAAYREVGEYQKAVESCQRVLEYNAESTGAYITLSKIEQKHKDYVKSLEYAKKAYEIDSKDINTIACLCIAYHYNKQTSERDRLFNMLKKENYEGIGVLEKLFAKH